MAGNDAPPPLAVPVQFLREFAVEACRLLRSRRVPSDSLTCNRYVASTVARGLRNDAIEVERLDPKPLNVRATDPKRVEVNSRHLSVDSFGCENGLNGYG